MPSMPADAVIAEAPPFRNPDTEDCSDCHDPDFMEVDYTVREIGGDHEEMTPFAHAVGRIWCFDCHDGDDRDMLRLANGELIEFEDTPTLCGQCHGDTHREWVAGVHGKRTGSWNGVKEYRVCSSCHDPHSPLFKPLKPEAAPIPPEVTR
jgi:formate-dependent nitrite reductase cytochrome c552 subunit